MTVLNPECQQGKHANCDGVGNIGMNYEPISCGCICHAGQGATHTTTRHATTCALLVKHMACTCGLERDS